MRHGDKVNNLSRTKSHRMALLSGLACQLIEHKRIVTTLAKAKALRVYVEPLITKSKDNTTHQRRQVFSSLNDKVAVTELFATVSPKVAGRPGGYTRIIKLGKRIGDNAELALIELVDFNEIYGKGIGETAVPAKKTRRSRASKKSADDTSKSEVSKADEEKEVSAKAAVTEEAPKEETPKDDASEETESKEA